jgi:hypothetical protein
MGHISLLLSYFCCTSTFSVMRNFIIPVLVSVFSSKVLLKTIFHLYRVKAMYKIITVFQFSQSFCVYDIEQGVSK